MPKGEQLGSKTKDIAYIIGVFLGDGSVSSKESNHLPYKTFSLQVIDRDFAEAVARSLSNLLGKDVGIKEYTRGNRLYFQVTVHEYILCDWLQAITEYKGKVPEQIRDSSAKVKMEFLRGLLDSEGYVELKQDRRPSNRSYTGWLCTVGLAAKSEWMKDVNNFFHDIDIRTRFSQDRRGFYYIKPRITDFEEAGLYFTIWRKQKKLNFYISYLRSSETIRETLKFER